MATTKERIAEAALRRFNRNGYASTTLTEIAADVGISQGNLTYHFPTKLDLALHLSEAVRVHTTERRASASPDDLVVDYVEQLRFALDLTWRFRFLMRDRGIFEDIDALVPPSPILVAAFDDRRRFIQRIAGEGLLRPDPDRDLDVLARSLWIVTRYWMDHLREMEGREELAVDDVERGVRHHFAVLLPTLTDAGRRRFTDALAATRPDTPA